MARRRLETGGAAKCGDADDPPVVYLIGSARSQRELDRTIQVARYIPWVKRVTSFVELRTGTPVAVQPSWQPGAGS